MGPDEENQLEKQWGRFIIIATNQVVAFYNPKGLQKLGVGM